MKKIYFIISLAILAGTASARQISEKEARAIATSKVPIIGKTAARIPSNGISPNVSEYAPVYIFNSSNGGFAIVAGDDRMPNMLLAYSETGTLDIENCSPAMKAWLEEMSAFITAGNFNRVSSSSQDYSKPVAPLITTKWDQGEPYNRLTPLGATGKHCYTGCAATAMAQVVNYWQWPKEGGLAVHSYEWNGQTLSVDFRESRYDWANMADVYDENSTEAQGNAVAKLMWDCGVACDMDYGEEMSSAISLDVAKGLVDYFGYNPGLRIRSRDFISDDEWFAIVNAELDAARPVLYCATTPNQEGHAFICDGYDESGLYHINWGWSGLCDGYYDLSTLEPDMQGSGGAASGEGFSQQQQIITGVRPAREGDVAAEGWELILDDFDIQPESEDSTTFYLEWTVNNLGYRPFVGNLLVYLKRDGQPDETVDSISVQIDKDNAMLPNMGVTFGVPGIEAASLEDGIYRMELKGYDEYTHQYMPVALPKQCPPMRFEIKNGKINVDYRSYLDIKLTEIDEIGFYYTSGNMRYTIANLTFNIENTSDIWFMGNLAVTVTDSGDVEIQKEIEETYVIANLPNIGPGEAYEITTPVQYRVGGKVKISLESCSLSEEEEAQEVVFNGNVIEFDADDIYFELALADMPKVTENEGKVTITAQVGSCTGDVNLEEGLNIDTEAVTEREVVCTIYNTESESKSESKSTYTGKWNEIKTLTFTTDEPLENGNYKAVLNYKSAPDADGNVLDLTLGDEIEDFPGISFTVTSSPVTNINDVDFDVDCQQRFNLQGIRVDDGYKGIVIKRSTSGSLQAKNVKMIIK